MHNNAMIDKSPERIPQPVTRTLFTDSTPILHDGHALRTRAAEDGYLFLRQLLPKDAIFALRRQMLQVMSDFGWRREGLDDLDGTVVLEKLNEVPEAEMRTDIGVSIEAYHAAQKIEALHALPHHPNLLSLYRTLLDTDVLVHPRHIARMITSHHSIVPTPPHQDFPLIQGTADTWTAWIPIGDCPRAMGGLTVLQGSHRNGYVPIQPSKGAGGIAVELCPYEEQWVEGDYEAGDVLTFPSYTIHKALRCAMKDQVRLSLDVRYQSAAEPIEDKSLNPHCDLTWAEIYTNWKSPQHQYYWQDKPLQHSPWNDKFQQPNRRIC